ncbi:uncharacterized protein LOC143911885 [Arctopsyche grandis]|uniref:uncharacterized protein LOC143911885 n=1 Tax=Arctopsyche grandis TaxID=121162 RepID=UPI00406D64DC
MRSSLVVLVIGATLAAGYVVQFPLDENYNSLYSEPISNRRLVVDRRQKLVPMIEENVYEEDLVPRVVAEEDSVEEDFGGWKTVVVNGKRTDVSWNEDENVEGVAEHLQKNAMRKWILRYCYIHPKCDVTSLIEELSF